MCIRDRIGTAERSGNWHGTTKGSVVLGGRRVTTERPRGRATTGGEIELDTWKAFSSADLLTSLVVERMLAGVATRRHVDVAEPVGDELDARSKSMSKSAISRRFVTATTKAMGELMARNLSDLDVAVLMIDGLDVAGSCVVVCLVITTDGTKVPVGLWPVSYTHLDVYKRQRYGYWGVSMGTLIGLPFVASEPRISAAVLGLAGLGDVYKRQLQSVSPWER